VLHTLDTTVIVVLLVHATRDAFKDEKLNFGKHKW